MQKSIFLVLLLCLIYSCKKESSNLKNNFVINGKISDIHDQTSIYLKTKENGTLVMIDSTIIIDGKFEFKGSVDKPVIYGVYIDGIRNVIGLFMENNPITIEAYKDSLASSKISGSKTNDDYLDFVKQSNRIISKMNMLFPVFQKARAENDAEKLKEINIKMQEISNNNSTFSLDYARKHNDSYIGALALHSVIRIPTIEKDTIAKIYNNFSDYVKKGDFALKTKTFLDSTKTTYSIEN